MRKVICHYHIYKNSGVSFDAVLKENYGERLISFDGPFPYFLIDQQQLSHIIERNRHGVAFSSHQTRLPVPVSLDFTVLPVVFLRHPLLRILSIYRFKGQSDDGTTTSKAARAKSFEEWVRYCFADSTEIYHVSNGQTQMVSAAYRQRPLLRRDAGVVICDIDQAMRNLRNVELLARTEYFNQDVGRFKDMLAEHGLEFRFEGISPKNVTSKTLDKPVDQRVAEVAGMLSAKTLHQLEAANAQDLQLYEFVSALIEHRG